MSERRSFDASIVIYAGVEVEHRAVITGTYHAAVRAYIYPGEYAPTDPPEPQMFEIESVVIKHPRPGLLKGDIDILPLLTEEQISALEEEGCNL